MPKTMTVKEIVAGNPAVDPKLLKQLRKALGELRRAGVRGKEYELASPINRRRATVAHDEIDSRTVHLRSGR